MDFGHYGTSYRRSIDGAQYTGGNGIANAKYNILLQSSV
jgi:hypothetical protein